MRDPRGVLGRSIGLAIVAGFVILGVVVVRRVVRHPQTDDAVVTADIIGVVPQVSGTITELHVKDNQRVKRGDLLVVIDPRPYEFALQRALSPLGLASTHTWVSPTASRCGPTVAWRRPNAAR